MTESFEYTRNKYCHEFLAALYFNSPGTIRENTYGKMIKGKEGELRSTAYFPEFDLTGVHEKLGITDTFLQDVCEFLEANSHIQSVSKTTQGLFQKIRFTKLGLTAYKNDHYLNENKQKDQVEQTRISTLVTNKRMIWLTFFLVLFAGLTLLKDILFDKYGKCSHRLKHHKDYRWLNSSSDTLQEKNNKDSLHILRNDSTHK